MAQSRVDDAINTLVTQLKAASSLTGVEIFDGPEPSAGGSLETIHVGWNGDPNEDHITVSGTQTWAGLGAKAKDENFTIINCVVVWSGDSTFQTIRNRAYAIFGAVEDLIKADISLTLPKPTIFNLESHQTYQVNSSSGVGVRIVFNISVMTRI